MTGGIVVAPRRLARAGTELARAVDRMLPGVVRALVLRAVAAGSPGAWVGRKRGWAGVALYARGLRGEVTTLQLALAGFRPWRDRVHGPAWLYRVEMADPPVYGSVEW